MIISKKRIISLDFLDKYKNDNIKIGIHVTDKEYEKLGIKEFVEGTAIQPSPEFGINCNRNSNGYSFPDKTKPKEDKVINTIIGLGKIGVEMSMEISLIYREKYILELKFQQVI